MSCLPLLLTAITLTMPAGLDQPCPVDFRGVRAADALGTLSRRTGVTYVVAAGLESVVLAREVRLTASHLTGPEAFRWVARLAGAEAVLVDNTFLIARPDCLPRVWRTPAGDRTNIRCTAARSRHANIHWQDTPPARIAADVAAEFGIDVIFQPELLEDAPLIEAEIPGASLDTVIQALSDRLSAKVEPLDGALWIHRSSVQSAPASAQEQTASELPGERQESVAAASVPGPLDAAVCIDRGIRDWPMLRERLAAAAGVPITVRGERAYPVIEAKATIGEVLEAGELLGYWTWNCRTGDQNTPFSVQLTVQSPADVGR